MLSDEPALDDETPNPDPGTVITSFAFDGTATDGVTAMVSATPWAPFKFLFSVMFTAFAGTTSVPLTHTAPPDPTTSTPLLQPKAAATWRLSAVSGATCQPRGSSIQPL